MRKVILVAGLELDEFLLRCAVLDDGTQVISKASLKRLFPEFWSACGLLQPSLLRIKGLSSDIGDPLFQYLNQKIQCKNLKGKTITVYKAQVLLSICKLFASTRFSASQRWQKDIAARCGVINAELSEKGLERLINEVTGYSKYQPHLSLNIQRYQKRFHEEFYREVCRLKGWRYSSDGRRTQAFAHITNKYVYDVFEPGFSKVLASINGMRWTGKCRESRHHQRLSAEGQNRLREHLDKLIVVMKCSVDWWDFEQRFARVWGVSKTAV